MATEPEDHCHQGSSPRRGCLASYLVLPSLTRVLASWPRLLTLDQVWLAVALAAEVASFTCTFALQRLALQTHQWGQLGGEH